MTDSDALRELVKNRGLKLKYIADCMGLSPYGLQRKIDNLSEFKTSEITAFSEAVGGLSFSEQKRLFFANVVDNYSTKSGA